MFTIEIENGREAPCTPSIYSNSNTNTANNYNNDNNDNNNITI